MPDVKFDASSMEALTRDLEESILSLKAQADISLPEIGAMLAATAKEIVEPHSKSIKVRDDSVPGLATIRGEAPGTPLARLYELGGSKGNKKGRQTFARSRKTRMFTARGLQSVSSFAHPVFGQQNTPWVDEKRVPFLRPAATRLRKVINARMVKALDDGLNPIFRR